MIKELSHAFKNICKNSSNVKLLLVGLLERDLDSLNGHTLEEIKVNKNSISVGFQKDVHPYFVVSDAIVFPSYREGNLHLELQSGVFEVLDNENMSISFCMLVVTSFTSEGTPLIRYDIGDSITLEDKSKKCVCGNHDPLI